MDKNNKKSDRLQENDTASYDVFVGVYGDGSVKKSLYTLKGGTVVERFIAYAYSSDKKKHYGTDRDTKKAAMAKARAKRDAYEQSPPKSAVVTFENPYQGLTLAQFAERINLEKSTLAESSAKKYREHVAWLRDPNLSIEVSSGKRMPIGDIPVDKVMYFHLLPFMRRLMSEKGRYSVKTFRGWLMEIVRKAQNLGLRPDNPARELEPVRIPRRGPVPVTSYTFLALLKACTCPRMKSALVLMSHGLRFSEVFGLTWSQFDGNIARVQYQRKRVAEPWEGGDAGTCVTILATRKSHADSYLAAFHDAEMKALVASVETSLPIRVWTGSDTEGRWIGDFVEGNRLVVPGPSGGFWAQTSFRRSLVRLVAKADLPHLKPHDCRRWFASECDRQGESTGNIQEALGHEDQQTTLRYISHDPQAGIRAHSMIGEILSGGL